MSFITYSNTKLMNDYLDKQITFIMHNTDIAYNSSIAAMLINRNYAAMRDTLETWCDSDNIVFIVVTDSYDNEVTSAGTDLKDDYVNIVSNDAIRVSKYPIEFEGQTYGYLYIALATQYIRNATNELIVQNVIIGVLGIIILILLLRIIIFYIVNGLRNLSAFAEKISDGYYKERAEVIGEDEIATLAKSLNTMIDTVEKHTDMLVKNHQMFKAIADYTYSWENWFDKNGVLQWINPAVQRISGYTPEECMAIEDFPIPLINPLDVQLVKKHIQDALQGIEGKDLEFRIRHKLGYDLWVAASWLPIYDEEGNSLGFRSSMRDVSLQRSAQDELTYQSEHDSLTGVYNRRAFEARIKRAVEEQRANEQPLTVLYIDIDQFKVINDSCGHVAGDQLLIDITTLLDRHTSNGFLARLGGDEFGVLFRGMDYTQAIRAAENILESIREFEFVFLDKCFTIGASIGVVVSDVTNSISNIMIAADTACYAAKERGRNQVVLYDAASEYFKVRGEEFSSIAQFNSGLSQGRFILYYQLVEPLTKENRLHAEVLLRIKDTNNGVQSPMHFIAAAERYNLMHHVDRWVVESVCKQLSEWDGNGIKYDVARFNINISGASLSDRFFPDFVANCISKYNIDPSRLCFEITESCAIAQLNTALSFIEKMHANRSFIALDDFGSGLSSFGYLKQFNVDYLKIDGQFIKNLDSGNPSDRAVVQSMVQLAKAYDLEIVAEYVCTEEIYNIVKEMDITYSQGFARHIPEPLVNLVARKE
jgi:diguanylate cyclase (GGDEF)-like protein/PAS domain S-box-containing protein